MENLQEQNLLQKVDATVTAVCKQDKWRGILYKALEYCCTTRTYPEAEAYLAGEPEYEGVIQSPFTLIGFLVKSGGIDRTSLDEAGNPIRFEDYEDVLSDELDELVCSYLLDTSEAGREVLGILDPQKRTLAKMAQKPHRQSTYAAVLEFCCEPHSLEDVKNLFKSRPDLVLDACMDSHTLSPDYYLNALESSGGLIWKGAWCTTDAGKAVLQKELQEQGLDIPARR